MNEDDSAGGHIGYSPAPPAVIDRRSNISGSSQMSSGSAVTISSMPRLPSVPSQSQIHLINSRIPYQLQQNLQQKSANNIIISSQSNSNTSNTSANKTLISVVTSSSDNLNNSSSSDLEINLNKKRIKLEDGDDELSAIKKRILEHKYLRLKNVREKYSEHVAELFFLQTGGNMMEYPVWRKKAQTPQLQNFMKSYKLDHSLSDETQTTDINSTLPHGAEIKIPGVGVTPVAVSTTLPAAVAQLNQQGGKPLVLDPLSINSFSDKRKETLTSLPSNTTQNTNGGSGGSSGNGGGGGSVNNNNNNSQTAGTGPEQFSAKARQEVYVMQRITELQKDGLWTEKRLPKLQEPVRPKAHWDYLLEEMVWLAADFAQERKWKKSAAKKCARMVQKYFQDKALAAQKAEKAQELHLKRIASFVAKEIKVFWNNVEKLVEYKQHTKLEEKRKKALDQHLSFIVDQTEKFSQQLVEGMNKSIDMNASGAPSLNSSRISSPKRKTGSDDEFSPGNVSSDDDEETIAKAEAEEDVEVSEEVAALQRESEMDLDDFLKELPKDYLQNREKIQLPESDVSQSEKSDEEFQATGDSSDDENTIMEQEKSEPKQDHKKEIEELNADNEMSIEDLLEKYKSVPKAVKMDVDSDDEESDNDESQSNNSEDEDDEMDLDTEGSQSNDEKFDDFDLKALLEDSANKDTKSDKDDLINDAAAIAESIQPKGNTLSSTNVVTPVPFLLKHSLREYQHIGLDWLVTMHDRKLNGILADEMGLGKTIQTISLLGHLACVKGIWGPHLIIVPSSVMLNWEMEFKKWCPGFKILTYYGTQKERKLKRIGWTKPNTFHVCITSYKLVIQDHQSFRRKKWRYLILDEAQNIKNFKSQRWQLLLNFNSDQRLLLTGTPLQNNLMELWSLMHFLMPHVFQSHREFKEWFSNPMTGMIEGNSEYNESIIKRLHKVLRPFLLRRLKCEVEKQMPKKYEHVVMCRLSKRQRFLYDDFMSRAKTRETLASGNLLSVINVLMQLRKVCNHPNLFEVRPTISPFRMEGINYRTASLVCNMLDYNPFKNIDLKAINLVLIEIELCMTAYVAHRIKKLATPRKLIEEIDSVPDSPPQCPSGKLKLHVRVKDSRVQDSIINHSGVKVGTSPAMKTDGTKFVPVKNTLIETTNKKLIDTNTTTIIPSQTVPPLTATTQAFNLRKRTDVVGATAGSGGGRINVSTSGHVAQIVQTSSGRHILLTPTNTGTTVVTQSGQRLTVLKNVGPAVSRTTQNMLGKPIMKVSPIIPSSSQIQSPQAPLSISQPLAAAIVHQWKNQTNNSSSITSVSNQDSQSKMVESEFYLVDKEQQRKERRAYQLSLICRINNRKCDASPIYGSDLRDCMSGFMSLCKSSDNTTCFTRSHLNCYMTMNNRDENWSLAKMIKSYEERFKEMESVFNNFVIFVPPVTAALPSLHISHPEPSKLNQENLLGNNIQKYLSPKLVLLHPIISAMSTQFPDPRLIQYDCGKLQTLDKVLRKLKGGGHRVLIFTQMTRMLDVLEAFLNYHGHIYLRLDGTTKIEQRQILMERFNGDKRIFVFILSTRSGGVGVNLTGADTVIFYDSDWNPTMDAQAQDRCHRIGQTRDVHIYRLISEKTIEENILKKANQKRLLGDLAIEGGNFTTAYFKSTTIKDIFNVDQTEENASARLSEVIDQSKERKRVQDNLLSSSSGAVASTSTNNTNTEEKSAINIFENALAAAEDEQDVEAATTAKAEAAAELAEFDETIPIEEVENKPELSKAEQEVENLIKQLSPIERYAMRFVEETGDSWTAEQLRQAEAEIEQQKREWEANRLEAIKKEEEEIKKNEEEDNEMLTFSAEDAKNQIWISNNSVEKMPMWCPPTPPQDDNDVYKDYSLTFLYDPEMIPETQLPPVYIKKEYKRNRIEAGFYSDGRRPLKIRKEDNYYPPRSLFDRPSPAIAKMRRDLKLQRYRGIFKPTVQLPGLKQQTLPMKPLIEPEGMAEWFIYEDMAILNVIQNLQGLPLNLMFLSPGHTPNWDLVADIVNQSSRIHRSAKQCRYRYEAVIVPREEGKLLESPKKQKKNKNPMKLSLKGVRSMRTAQSYINDNNTSFTKLVKLKFENIRTAYLNKAPLLKQILVNPSLRNPKHAAVLQDFGITNYESPPTPVEIATRRQERITKDKQKLPVLQVNDLAQSQTVGTQQQHQQQQQQQIQQPSTTIVVQQQQQQQQLQNSSPITTIVQTAQQTAVRPTVTSITIPQQQQTQQIVKAIVATPTSTNLVSNTLHQQLAISNQSQQLQLTTQSQQQQQQQQVSVVLTTPITTISSIQQQQLQQSNQTQIVSIHQNINNNTIVTQTTSLMQTLPTQSMPQVVSVSQLASVGAVISTAGLQSNQNVATLTSSPLRAQRIVTTPGGLQEVVLHPRSGSQSPTVVSVSSLGQGLTQAQLQAAQLRLQMSAGQQVQGVVAKGIQVSTLQNAGKPANTSIFYRQNVRQQFKVLHTTPGQGATVVQTAGGQATLVSPGTIIQGGIVQQANVGQTVQVQSATGQKMSVATIGGVNNATGVVTSVATVQVAPGQARTQFIKHVGKQTIARQVSESEVQALMIKRQLLNQQHKVQQGGVQQTQIFAPTSVQLQQPGTSGQQIATLVKTAGGVTAATLSQVKAGQIKATMANPNQVRQLQLQQQLALQRKGGKMTQFTHVAGKGGVPTQLIVQNPKVLPGTVTVQQIQQVIRHAQPGQIVLGKTGVSRVIPGNVAQANARQTIQVLTATSAAGNIRHVAGTQNITGLQGTIKVTSSGATVQQQQALLNALQNQHQRQNPSPVRIQTTQGSLVAVTLQQQQQQQQQQPTTTVVSVSSAQQQQQQQQNTTNTQHDVISNVTSTTLHNQQTQQSQQQTQQQQQQQNQQVVQKYFVIP